MKDSKSPKCPACESKQVLTNKHGLRRCRRCGCEWDKNKIAVEKNARKK